MSGLTLTHHAILFVWLGTTLAFSQIDPVQRDLVQIGYNAALQGHPPISAYAFYYHNTPEFLRTNLALRIAVAPTYIDSELGVREALGPRTDLGIGAAGGGFADSYAEIRQGTYLPAESFVGHGAQLSLSAYHRFNPEAMIPLHGIVRTSARASFYNDSDSTDPDFVLPDNRGTFALRSGVRWGGREPTLYPSLAMTVSAWYEGQYRTSHGVYGYDDREVEPASHLIWAEAGLVYTTDDRRHNFEVTLSSGTSFQADRFSTYRLGALLPLVSEFPLSLPGYYYEEISARSYFLIGASYLHFFDPKTRWAVNITGASAAVDYLDGFEQPGDWQNGVGVGILYRTRSWKMMVGYGYGINAIRSSGQGAHSIGVLMQLDWGTAREQMFSPTTPNLWRGLGKVFGLFGG